MNKIATKKMLPSLKTSQGASGVVAAMFIAGILYNLPMRFSIPAPLVVIMCGAGAVASLATLWIGVVRLGKWGRRTIFKGCYYTNRNYGATGIGMLAALSGALYAFWSLGSIVATILGLYSANPGEFAGSVVGVFIFSAGMSIAACSES